VRELNLFGADDLRWVEKPEPVLLTASDAIVRPFVVSRCDGDVLPIHARGVTRGLQAGLKAGLIDPAVGHICGPVPFRGPFAIGHECIAEVVNVSSQVRDVQPGDRVVVPGQSPVGSARPAGAD
jgi:threonine dehydrogenase-like Zn-dependent dehydrogenase